MGQLASPGSSPGHSLARCRGAGGGGAKAGGAGAGGAQAGGAGGGGAQAGGAAPQSESKASWSGQGEKIWRVFCWY